MSTELGGSLVSSAVHKIVCTFLRSVSRLTLLMCSRKFSAITTAKTWPSLPTLSANSRVKMPVPAPTSATVTPGLMPSCLTISSRFANTSRLSISNFSINSFTFGSRKVSLTPGRTLLSCAGRMQRERAGWPGRESSFSCFYPRCLLDRK